MLPVGPFGHTWTANAKSFLWPLHSSWCLWVNRRAWFPGFSFTGNGFGVSVSGGVTVTQRHVFSCSFVCLSRLDFQAIGGICVCCVRGQCYFFAMDIRLALCHFLTTLSHCTDMSLHCEAEANGMSPFLCPPAIDCQWESCWPHWGCVLLGELLLPLLDGAACPPPGPARGAQVELPQESGSVSAGFSKGAEPAGHAHREKDIL